MANTYNRWGREDRKLSFLIPVLVVSHDWVYIWNIFQYNIMHILMMMLTISSGQHNVASFTACSQEHLSIPSFLFISSLFLSSRCRSNGCCCLSSSSAAWNYRWFYIIIIIIPTYDHLNCGACCCWWCFTWTSRGFQSLFNSYRAWFVSVSLFVKWNGSQFSSCARGIENSASLKSIKCHRMISE